MGGPTDQPAEWRKVFAQAHREGVRREWPPGVLRLRRTTPRKLIPKG
jgi:hypothetical protein